MSNPNSGYFKVNYQQNSAIHSMSEADEYERGLILILLSSYSYHLSPIVIDNGWVKVGGDEGIINNFSDMCLYKEDEEVITFLIEIGISKIFIEGVDFDYENMTRSDIKVILNLESLTVVLISQNTESLKGDFNSGIMNIKTDVNLSDAEKARNLKKAAQKYELSYINELFESNNLEWID